MPSTPLLFPQLALISRSKQSSCEARKSNSKFGTLLAKNVFIRSPHHITEEQWVCDISKKCATFCIYVGLEFYFPFFVKSKGNCLHWRGRGGKVVKKLLLGRNEMKFYWIKNQQNVLCRTVLWSNSNSTAKWYTYARWQ